MTLKVETIFNKVNGLFHFRELQPSALNIRDNIVKELELSFQLTHCYGLNMSPLKFSGASGMCSGHEVGVLMNEISALKTEAPESFFAPSTMWE